MNDLKAAIDYTFVFLEDELADAKKKYHEAEQLRIDKENNPEKNWNWKWKDGGYWPTHHEAQARKVQTLTTALAALRDALKRAEGCDTCMKGQAMFGDVLWAINKDGKAVININGEQANTVFPYCPMCGRKLEVEE